MIDTDSIFLATSRLAEDGALRAAAVAQLKAVCGSPAYRDWQSSPSQLRPFKLPASFTVDALNTLGLVQDGALGVRVNLIGQSTVLTDGVWVDARIRVFPFADESEAILAYCRRRGLVHWADTVIDLATGSGHNLAFFGNGVRRIGMDINPRALAYFHCNHVLNEQTDRVGMLNDIRDGFAGVVGGAAGSRTLVLGNLPFGLASTRDMLALTSNGGDNGLQLQGAAFRAIAAFRQTPQGAHAHAVLLGYSLGNAATKQWELVDLAKSIVGADSVVFDVPAHEGLLRVDGRRTMANPSPLRPALDMAGGCRLYHPDPVAARTRYAALSDRFIAQGFNDLAYVIVEIAPAGARA
ncbi:hypothetical protein [Ramlibacter sp.]|uniref:hypothetical protein n=1 Tax=Ramlibacter sp. TaxID=1917967 RepID=UPI00185B2EE6|nr:hypothetical protein [Ramlibacter sp.]MBA2676322.1 hypothetical protein [Ramlibacter sp.]